MMAGVHTVACPYCRTTSEVQSAIGWQELKCAKTECRGKWHEGVFRTLCITVVNRNKRSLGRDAGVLWNIRCKTGENEELVSFRTKNRGIQLKRGDVVVLSFQKEPKGLLKMVWSGRWDSRPKTLVNNNIAAGWEL